MAGGGKIIIRSIVKQSLSAETIAENLSPNSQARRSILLAKNEADWSHNDVCDALHLIGEADWHCAR